MIVDSHCHVSDRWYEPVEVLLSQMDRHGVDQAILVQLLGQFDNQYQQQCVARFPDRFASVVAVDVEQASAVDTLRALADSGAFGLRLRPTDRSPGDDPLAIWRAASELGLVVSCVGTGPTFASREFANLVAEFPTMPIVLEHLGGTSTPDPDEAARTARVSSFELARNLNVHIKLPGLGELVPRAVLGRFDGAPTSSAVPAVLLEALSAFGPGRILWGSDFPVVSSREGYGNALRWTREAVDAAAPNATANIFGKTAQRLFARGGWAHSARQDVLTGKVARLPD